MSAGPVSIADTDTVPEAVEFLTKRGFGAAVVIDAAGHPIGVVTKTDVLMHTRRRKPGLEPDDTLVTEVMTPAVFSVRPETSARSVIEQLLKTDVLMHTRRRKPGLEPDDTLVTEVMTPAVFSVRPETSARSVIEQLLETGVHHLFVMDASGVIVGVISPVDVLKKLK